MAEFIELTENVTPEKLIAYLETLSDREVINTTFPKT